MHRVDEHNESDGKHPSSSQKGAPGSEDEMIEDEIGELLDELTQEGEKK